MNKITKSILFLVVTIIVAVIIGYFVFVGKQI